MGSYYEAYIYNEALKEFENVPITLDKLIELHKSKKYRFNMIHNHLYTRKDTDVNYKLVFYPPGKKKAYLRRQNTTEHLRKGFSSAVESKIHDACKRGIAASERLKLVINGKEYIVEKESADCEKICSYMEKEYETDCEYIIKNCDKELMNILKGKTISFEIHHTSPVKEEKGLSYMLNGNPIIEFPILIDYLPEDIKSEKREFGKMIDYFKTFYENTDSHYISGTFFEPMGFHLDWKGNLAKHTEEDGNDIEIRVFYRDDSYRILYKSGESLKYDNDYYGVQMRKKETAIRYAEYRLNEHINGRVNLF